jgi:MoaA/NifB/PqqE/SkfB family radical SAM enzyme
MDLDVFRSLPFRNFRYVHLQGWGEPLLNPEIAEMVDIAKSYGCEVGITTNGILLGEFLDVIAGMDLVAVSIAGVEEHEEIRGCNLNDLLQNIELLSERRRSGKPKIVVVTMMLKDTIRSLPKVVEIAKKRGADEVIANNLDYIPHESLVGREVFTDGPNPYSKIIERASIEAKRKGIRFVAKPVRLEEALMCAENPLRNCLITVDGRVSPCVYLHLPTKADKIPRYFRGRRVEVPKIYFGKADDFIRAWRSREYTKFRSSFEKRIFAIYDAMLFNFPSLPEVCKSCYKAYSV